MFSGLGALCTGLYTSINQDEGTGMKVESFV